MPDGACMLLKRPVAQFKVPLQAVKATLFWYE